jgi:HSP20 family protein
MAESEPWDDWSKRRRRNPDDPFEGFFPPEFQQEFEKMREYMNRMMGELMRGFDPSNLQPGRPGQPGQPGGKPGEPYVYGFSVRMGPDGKPQFQPFGNTNPVSPAAKEGAREPLTDVIPDEKQVAVTVELPGASKGDINLHVADEDVTIKVEGGRRYFKRIRLPVPVIPNTANATFKNGILDLTIERAHPGAASGHKVDIQ